MIIFLYGRDGYRLKQNLDKITAEYRKKNTGMSLSVVDFGPGAENSTRQQLEKLTDLIKTVSFFNEKRLIVLKSAFLLGKEVTDLTKNWELANDKERILIFVENSGKEELIKRDKGLFNLLSTKPNIAKSFEPLRGRRLENWLREEIESLGGKIDSAAVKKIISCVTSPPSKNEVQDPAVGWRLKQEIEKLINYKLADGFDRQNKLSVSDRGEIKIKRAVDQSPERSGSIKNLLISAADVELMVGPNVNLNIFEIVDAIADKNQRKALRTLYGHLENGVDPYYIFSMIVYQFRNLLKVKALAKNALAYAGIIKKAGLHPYVVKKTFEQCKKFDLEELKRLFNQLARLDIETKTGKIDMAEGLYQFVFSLKVPAPVR